MITEIKRDDLTTAILGARLVLRHDFETRSKYGSSRYLSLGRLLVSILEYKSDEFILEVAQEEDLEPFMGNFYDYDPTPMEAYAE